MSTLTLAKDLEQQSKAQQKSTGEMLKAAFWRSTSSLSSGTERKREENQRRHPRPRAEYERGDGENRRSVLRTAGGIWPAHPDGVSAADRHERSILWWQGQQITDILSHLRQQEDTLAKMTARMWSALSGEYSDGLRRFLSYRRG
ncbi:MbeB family mobilization protein [Escherichia coli]